VSPDDRTRIPEVDGLRAIAIALVVAYHFEIRVTGGFLGVDLFFAISGYVITRNIIATINDSPPIEFLRTFYRRRVLRLLPAALVLCVVVVAVAAAADNRRLFGEPSLTAKNALAGLVGIGNWFQLHIPEIAQGESRPLLHMWSLSIEEQFYLALPLLLVAFRRRLVLAVFVVGAATMVVGVGAALLSPSANEAFFSTPSRITPVGAGVLLAGLDHTTSLRQRLREWKFRSPALGALLGLLAVLSIAVDWGAPWLSRGGFAVLSLPFAGIVALAGAGGSDVFARMLRSRAAQFVGARSYSLYLWHFPLAFLFDSYPFAVRLVLRIVLSAVLAEASFRFVENPMRRTKGQLWGRLAPLVPIAMVVGAIVFVATGTLDVP
jgi:peptidoglycan/LPS O-acetylase OafA/YrhL